jgi:lipoprotein-releasing system ATP-binding protein
VTGAIVEVEGLVFSYTRSETVLGDLTTSFCENAVHAVTGPSGCGKSTLLYIIGLMLRPSSGRVRVVNDELATSSDKHRALHRAKHIGFVFQDALLEPSMTVFQNVADGLPLHLSRAEYYPQIREHLERLGLAELRDRKASRLSGGQGQRVALARAMLKRPKVLLADEPTGNLDDTTAKLVLDEIFAYGRQAGKTTIIVTHDARVAARADTVLHMDPVIR